MNLVDNPDVEPIPWTSTHSDVEVLDGSKLSTSIEQELFKATAITALIIVIQKY
ncbi:hypothetical protein KAR91_74490 [Candidatus Pacearchaeota archaeon]|nr:hypothetical protein [Candidatus Pacearchaeota archaeon]